VVLFLALYPVPLLDMSVFKTLGNLKCMLSHERNQSEKATDSIILALEKAKLLRQWLSGVGGGRGRRNQIGGAQRIFRAVKRIQYYNGGGMSLYNCSSLRICNTKSDLGINYVLSVITMCECGVINYTKHSLWYTWSCIKRSCAYLGKEDYADSLSFPVNFAMNLKLLKK
jgi:hypothetical protein